MRKFKGLSRLKPHPSINMVDACWGIVMYASVFAINEQHRWYRNFFVAKALVNTRRLLDAKT